MLDTLRVSILIIEDDPYVRRLYERVFSYQKYKVDVAQDGETGLQKAKEYKYSLILLDMMMPKMNGLTVLEKLKADPETAPTPVFILTNFADENVTKEATDKGAERVLLKSEYPPDLLVEMVNKSLSE